jgi:hypothetical protein
MKEILESTIKVLKVSIEEIKADIFVGPLPMIKADELQMSRLILNLVANAIKFHGPERPKIRIITKPGANEWTFSVRTRGSDCTLSTLTKYSRCSTFCKQEEYPGTGVSSGREEDLRASWWQDLGRIRGRQGSYVLLHYPMRCDKRKKMMSLKKDSFIGLRKKSPCTNQQQDKTQYEQSCTQS